MKLKSVVIAILSLIVFSLVVVTVLDNVRIVDHKKDVRILCGISSGN